MTVYTLPRVIETQSGGVFLSNSKIKLAILWFVRGGFTLPVLGCFGLGCFALTPKAFGGDIWVRLIFVVLPVITGFGLLRALRWLEANPKYLPHAAAVQLATMVGVAWWFSQILSEAAPLVLFIIAIPCGLYSMFSPFVLAFGPLFNKELSKTKRIIWTATLFLTYLFMFFVGGEFMSFPLNWALAYSPLCWYCYSHDRPAKILVLVVIPIFAVIAALNFIVTPHFVD